MKNNNEFTNRLKIALVDNNFKPIDLSKKTGIDRSAISNYLSGSYQPNSSNLLKIAEVLNVNEKWLLGYDVSKSRDDLLDNSDILLSNIIVDLSKDPLEREILIKVTMLDNKHQEKLLEHINLLLKDQGDYYEKDELGGWYDPYDTERNT